jgi:6-pyruvoyl-tetrahydropterin synthase
MYTVGVRDHIMVAHGLSGEVPSPTPRLQGATYTVTAELSREELYDTGMVFDVVELRRELRAVLDGIDYQNIDAHPAFEGNRSTTELIARHVHRELGRRLPMNLRANLTVTLDESPLAWARYAAPLRGGSIAPTNE